jgi:hypothetical protein
MPRIAEQARPVTGDVDTHAGVHVAAAVDQVGRVLGTGAFPADAQVGQRGDDGLSAMGTSMSLGLQLLWQPTILGPQLGHAPTPTGPGSPRTADHKPGCWSL